MNMREPATAADNAFAKSNLLRANAIEMFFALRVRGRHERTDFAA
jgi:hypothetical protein